MSDLKKFMSDSAKSNKNFEKYKKYDKKFGLKISEFLVKSH